MKVRVDYTKCTGHGVCESLVPSMFELDDQGNLTLRSEVVPDELRDQVRSAVERCPTEALSVSD